MRTTIAEVKAIMPDLDDLTDPMITAYIQSANTFLDVLAGTTLTVAQLTNIETWLTCHMIAVTRERQAKKEGAGGAFIEYSGVFGDGLKSTSYGQMVLMLDTTETLISLGGKQVKIFSIKSFDD